jgi:hypothetical protein
MDDIIRICRRRCKIALTIILLIGLGTVVNAGKVEIPDGQEVKIKFDSQMPISSGTATPGVPLLIHLAEPIEIGDVVIVEKDAIGTATVAEVEKAGKGGKPGRIKVEFTDLEPKGEYSSPDKEKIKLSGSIESKGKGKKLLSYLFIAGLFIKGNQGVINADSIYTATVIEPILLESR